MQTDKGAALLSCRDRTRQRLMFAVPGRQPVSHWACLTGLTAISVVLLFAGLGDRPLWDVDEGMHAVIARNMANSGDWVTPVFNGIPFMDKPPLVNWLGAISFKLLGFSELAARLPSAVLGFGCVFLTYRIGCRQGGRVSGFVAAVVLATSLEFIIVSRIVQYDIPFTFFTTLALYCFCLSLSGERQKTLYWVGFYVAVALAVLTKGPLGLFLPIMAIGLYFSLQRRWSYLGEMRLLSGSAIILVITVPWFVLMEAANPGYLEYFVMKQHLANLFGTAGNEVARHPEPIYYFAPVLLAGMFPWSLLLPQAVFAAVRNRSRAEAAPSIFMASWTVCIFVFFSLASSKLSTYILPAFPAIAVLIGTYLVEHVRQRNAAQSWLELRGAAKTALLFIGSVTAYIIVADPWIMEAQTLGIQWAHLEWLLIAMSATVAAALLLLSIRRRVTAFAMSSLTVPTLVFFLLVVAMPKFDSYKSGKEIGIEYGRILGPGERMIFANKELDSAMFYTNRESLTLGTEQDIRSALDSNGVAYLVLTHRSDAVSDRILRDYHVISRIGNKAIVGSRSTLPVDRTAAGGR